MQQRKIPCDSACVYVSGWPEWSLSGLSGLSGLSVGGVKEWSQWFRLEYKCKRPNSARNGMLKHLINGVSCTDLSGYYFCRNRAIVTDRKNANVTVFKYP